jgi:hypothetical protein
MTSGADAIRVAAGKVVAITGAPFNSVGLNLVFRVKPAHDPAGQGGFYR